MTKTFNRKQLSCFSAQVIILIENLSFGENGVNLSFSKAYSFHYPEGDFTTYTVNRSFSNVFPYEANSALGKG
jgi:hypothetical protein